jgi:hypothetical protein
MKTIIIALASVVLISACDIVEPPFRKNFTPRDTTDTSDTLSSERIVLLEKFTGHTCGPCPQANDEAQIVFSDLKNVSIISYHAGQNAKIEPTNGYLYEFRTQAGNEIGTSYFQVVHESIITPMGVVDRLGYGTPSTIRVGWRNWKTIISNRFLDTSQVAIRLYPWYNPATKTITVSGSIHYLEAGFKDYHLTLALTEDSIIKPQKLLDGSKDTNYVHKFVFRSNIPNTTWGSSISASDQPKGSKIEFTRELQFPSNSDWNPKHLKVVGYVYRNFNIPTVSREVLQSRTEKVKIVP